jgi:hypothetical protein
VSLKDLSDWMANFGRPGVVWYLKRLSANDTLANGAHQAGPYIPKEFLFSVFPTLNDPARENPDLTFNFYIDSHSDHRLVRAVWYNNRIRGGTRNEARLTNFGGSRSALLDPESTGALTVFAFVVDANGVASECHVWVCVDRAQEDLIEERLGPVEPKSSLIWYPGVSGPTVPLISTDAEHGTCRMAANEIPADWLRKFPSGEEIVRKTLELRPPAKMPVDVRLLKRRQCEFEIFQSVEEATYLPRVRQGFDSMAALLGVAQTILQSRKSRSGNSLELHSREILKEEGLRVGADFVHRPVIEGGKRPDFLFPTVAAYESAEFPDDRLRMLAAKTTCKDRWRQVINEADRIRTKHLLTLQQGVSEGQFREMQEAGVQLVVPKDLHGAYPESVRPHLVGFKAFIDEVRSLSFAS